LSSDNKKTSFFEELKRRNVYRVGVAYAVLTWLILQVIDTVTPILSLPDFALKLVLTILVIGFPAALLFAWAFELTPEGIKREKDVDRSHSITSQTGQRLDRITIGVVLVAIGILIVDRFLLPDQPAAQSFAETGEAVEETADAAEATDDVPSIAVLPFMNMSADESSTYFSDGLADTMLHMLAQIPEIRVAARTSSFQFRDQAMDISKIGEQLNVATVLEGSVQRAGDKVRITAQLIDVDNGFHLWSGNFDRDLNDVFAIQDEIANEVVAALKVSLLGEVAGTMDRDQTQNIDAYTEYLLGLSAVNQASTENFKRAVVHLQKALEYDPNYARAWSTLGHTYVQMQDYGVLRPAEAASLARDAASRALEIAPESSEALAVLGMAEALDSNFDQALELLAKAAETGPNDAVAAQYYSIALMNFRRPQEALEMAQRAAQLDPLSEGTAFQLASMHMALDDFESAEKIANRLLTINPNSANASGLHADIARAQGHIADAIQHMDGALEADPNDPEIPWQIAMYYLNIDMPEEAQRWFDRAVEIDPEHPVSQAAPLYMGYYLQDDIDETARIARALLEGEAPTRRGARFIALNVLYEYSLQNDRLDGFLEVLDNLYPYLFDAPPYDFERSFMATFFVGLAEFHNGNEERGSAFLRAWNAEVEASEAAYNFTSYTRISIASLIDNEEADLTPSELASVERYPSDWSYLYLDRSIVYDPLREDPEFKSLIDEYRANAITQQQLLQASNED